MVAVKTSVSLPEELLMELEARARDLSQTRSAFIQDAIAAYLRRLKEAGYQSRINEAYAEPDSDDERRTAEAVRRLSARALRREPR